MRESGILFPVFSIPSKFGIGSFSREAYEFVDFLNGSGQGFWQILPMGPTGYGNSPYQPVSSFAGNPYFISLETLIEEGLLQWDEVNHVSFGGNEEVVDYGALYENRTKVLKLAYARFAERLAAGKGTEKDKAAENGKQAESAQADKDEAKAYQAYKKKEAFWLEDYALFTAIKTEQGGKSWLDWEDEGLKKRKAAALKDAEKRLADEIDYIIFTQYEFDKQWGKLRAYAKSKNVKIIGDLPFYVALDSADAWSHPEAFQMDKDLVPKVVAGCPPDAFSYTGQLWGNPIYDWKAMKKNGYEWWAQRIERNYEFYDVIRIDHFHGFCDYWAVPYGDQTAEKGKLEKGPGMDFFEALKAKVPQLQDKPDGRNSKDGKPASDKGRQDQKLRIIAEDLGNNTPENEKLLEDTGFPGMKVVQYGFTSWDSYYVNHRHIRNCVVYTGTHDNTTSMAWIQEINDGERDFVRRYINSQNTDYGQFVWDFIREAYRSVADLCIVPLQDYLCKGKEARINTPGTGEGNWQWRLKPNFLSKDLERSIRGLSELYSRIPKVESEDAGNE
ncbi:MAG: 4-alpha-glucanotransferase [Lachnospiraceae bacterium]|nr:4-alpha-glucanotransferase [Lachnospiraceae bacterium]